jgi:hypothetical protein
MANTVQETHRLGTSVNVKVVGGDYARYVPAADWDADPQAVAAGIAEHLASLPAAPVTAPAVNKNPVVMTDQEIADKLKAISDAKLAALQDGIPA